MPDTQKTFLALVKAPAVRNVEICLESSDILDAIYDDDDYDDWYYDDFSYDDWYYDDYCW